MSNVYCTIEQFQKFFDVRSIGMLSNDDGVRNAVADTVQANLDAAASELDTHLAGWVSLPLTTVPMILTRWVAAKTIALMYARRSDRPKGVDADLKWADDWIKAWDEGQVVLPGTQRTARQLSFSGRAAHLNQPTSGFLTQTPFDNCSSTW